MRRLFGFLMVVALLTALVPSATLAGKPPAPSVYGFVAAGTSLYPAASGCPLWMQVTYEGRATYLVVSNTDSALGATRNVPIDKSGATSFIDDVTLTSLNGTVTWSLYLANRKLQPVSATQTVSETFNGSACPIPGEEIGAVAGVADVG